MSIEDLLPEVVATLVVAGELLLEMRRKREEQERERQLAEQRRYEEEQKRNIARNRWRKLVEVANGWRDATVVRGFLNALKANGTDQEQIFDGKTLSEWIAWAEALLQDFDPMQRGAATVFGSIAEITAWSYPERRS